MAIICTSTGSDYDHGQGESASTSDHPYNVYQSWSPEDRAESERLTQFMAEGLRALGHRVAVAEFWKDVRPALQPFDPDEWIVFNWCEGVEDEIGGDARVCAEMEAMGFTYTGNPPHALRLSVQKGRAKQVLQRWGIPTAPGREFQHPDQVTEQTWDEANFPAIVKPVSAHCSVAVTREAVVCDLASLRERVAYVIETVKEPALAEKFIVGREINIGIWGNGRPRLLPLREIDFSQIANPLHHLLTWDSKWVPTSPDWNSMPVITAPKVSRRCARALSTSRSPPIGPSAVGTTRAWTCGLTRPSGFTSWTSIPTRTFVPMGVRRRVLCRWLYLCRGDQQHH